MSMKPHKTSVTYDHIQTGQELGREKDAKNDS